MWLNKMGLDDTKSYSRPQESLGQERFNWAQVLFNYVREDETRKYFKVEASFPLSSMNNYVYTEDELLRGARSLVGKPVNLNHEGVPLVSVTVEGAEYEDGAVECVLGFLKGSDVLGMVEKGEIVHVSTEADCLQGTEMTPEGSVCKGLVYTGLALLTKMVLPGVPLTRIMPVESIVESFQVMVNGGEKVSEKEEVIVKEGEINEKSKEKSSEGAVKTEVCKCPKCGSGNVNKIIALGEDTKAGRAQGFKDLDLYPERPCMEFECEDCKHYWPNPEFEEWSRKQQAEQGPRTDADRAKAHFSLSDSDWNKLSEEEKQAYIAKLPPRGSANTESVTNSPCEEAKEALLVRVSALEGKVQAIEAVKAKDLKDLGEKVAADKKALEAKRSERPSVLTKEGFWARFHELRKDGCNKTDAFRLVSMEVIEASTKQQ
jgi:hypothetical protein